MSSQYIKINFKGGIVSPGELYNILVAATRAHIHYVGFGLRQQLLVKVEPSTMGVFTKGLDELGVFYQTNNDGFPNITSSYPAEEVFINNTWLSEGVYKDIFDAFDYEPALKVNICDSNQSFAPLLTGNVNWMASPSARHYWHLFIRFPKTNIIFEWDQLTYTNDIARLSKQIEAAICDNIESASGALTGKDVFNKIDLKDYILKQADAPASLPAFNLPYYEGLNRYNNKFWLGIYRRDELFSVDFLKELCLLCLQTKIGQICSTPWKTIIIKAIEEKDRIYWNRLLEKYQVNVRHASNELNFQVEDNCDDGLALKNWLVKNLNDDDIRSFGICIGIKTRKKSEVFSSILIRKKSLLKLFGISFFNVYDILCAHDFNPNERTGFVFSKNNPRFVLAEQLRRSIVAYYKYRASFPAEVPQVSIPKKTHPDLTVADHVFQCKDCLTVYDERTGDEPNGIRAGTAFGNLPAHYCCPVCETPASDFRKIARAALTLQAV